MAKELTDADKVQLLRDVQDAARKVKAYKDMPKTDRAKCRRLLRVLLGREPETWEMQLVTYGACS